ncbi:rap guanine nucleotide exchange factor 2 isoform X3, partial [Tachysurus ichikawai]
SEVSALRLDPPSQPGSKKEAGWNVWLRFGKRSAGSLRRGCECIVLEPSEMIVVDYMDENEEYFQRQASHRQSRRRFRKINQKGERQTIIDTVEPYQTGKPPISRGYHTLWPILRNKEANFLTTPTRFDPNCLLPVLKDLWEANGSVMVCSQTKITCFFHSRRCEVTINDWVAF